MWSLIGCAMQGSPELVVAGPDGATLPGQGSWYHDDVRYDNGTDASTDRFAVSGYPPELGCATFQDTKNDPLPADLVHQWNELRDRFDDGDHDGACALQRDYYEGVRTWADGWSEAGLIDLDLGVDDDFEPEGFGFAYLDLVGTIDYALDQLDCDRRPRREAPYPYTLGTERVEYLARSGTVRADARQDSVVLTFDRYRMEAEDGEGDDLVLDGVAVLDRCVRTYRGPVPSYQGD